MVQQWKNGKWVTMRELKPLHETARFKSLIARAERTGMIVDLEDSELVTLQSAAGILINDTLDYDSVNTSDAYCSEGRREFFEDLKSIIDDHERVRSQMRCKNCGSDCSFAGKTEKEGVAERRNGQCKFFVENNHVGN